LDGLASGVSVALDIRSLMTGFSIREQITRLVCVEGWSAIPWWAGLRFDDLLRAYPPASQAKWVRVESSVNLDASGNPDPYYVSIDLATARHPQTLLATHLNGQPLTVEHGAPLRLLVPVKLGLKNVKAITKLTYVAQEPRDYWAERSRTRRMRPDENQIDPKNPPLPPLQIRGAAFRDCPPSRPCQALRTTRPEFRSQKVILAFHCMTRAPWVLKS
jgi:DMSO/TMAO reductase YedYZ molybdopterin-dependent catalytic subunit